MIGGLAPISQDVPPFTMTDHDGHIAGINLVGLKRAGYNSEQRAEIKEAFRLLYREKLPIAQVVAMLGQNEHCAMLQPLIDFLSGSNRGLSKASFRLRRAA
jgi:UDP-N-acetylglucosamine acyltransferase